MACITVARVAGCPGCDAVAGDGRCEGRVARVDKENVGQQWNNGGDTLAMMGWGG